MASRSPAYDYAAQPMQAVPACPVCGQANASQPATDRFGFAIGVSACACGLQYLNPRLTDAAYAEFYAQWYRPLLKTLPVYRGLSDAQMADTVGRQMRGSKWALHLRQWGVKRIDHLLDVGGSTGDVALGLAQHVSTSAVTVLDPNPQELAVARAYGWATLEGRAETLPVGASYDGILCTRTADHWTDPLAALRAMRAALAPGGWLLIDMMETHPGAYKIDHPLYWTPASFADALRRTGWDLVQRAKDWRSFAYFCHGHKEL